MIGGLISACRSSRRRGWPADKKPRAGPKRQAEEGVEARSDDAMRISTVWISDHHVPLLGTSSAAAAGYARHCLFQAVAHAWSISARIGISDSRQIPRRPTRSSARYNTPPRIARGDAAESRWPSTDAAVATKNGRFARRRRKETCRAASESSAMPRRTPGDQPSLTGTAPTIVRAAPKPIGVKSVGLPDATPTSPERSHS